MSTDRDRAYMAGYWATYDDKKPSKKPSQTTIDEILVHPITYFKPKKATKSPVHQLPSTVTMDGMDLKDPQGVFPSHEHPSRHDTFLSSCGRVHFEQSHRASYPDKNEHPSSKHLRDCSPETRQKYYNVRVVSKSNSQAEDNTAMLWQKSEEKSEAAFHARGLPTSTTNKMDMTAASANAMKTSYVDRERSTSKEQRELMEAYERSRIRGDTATSNHNINHPADLLLTKTAALTSHDLRELSNYPATEHHFECSSKIDPTSRAEVVRNPTSSSKTQACLDEVGGEWVDADEEFVRGDEWEFVEGKQAREAAGDGNDNEWVWLSMAKKI